MSACQRREQVLDVAIAAFGESGYTDTKTDDIARRAGVSQPYVIRLFGTKEQLYIAVLRRVFDRIEDGLRESAAVYAAVEYPSEQLLHHFRACYERLLLERQFAAVLLHALSASSQPRIRSTVRERYDGLYFLVQRLTGASAQEVGGFLGAGMLLTVMSAMQVIGPGATPTTWSKEIVDGIFTDRQVPVSPEI
jgi:AcrR family transcriptional regulator